MLLGIVPKLCKERKYKKNKDKQEKLHKRHNKNKKPAKYNQLLNQINLNRLLIQ